MIQLATIWGDAWGLLTSLTDRLHEFSSHWWFLLVILVIALLDSVIPIVPSETAVIAGGVAAGSGNQNLALVILAGATGAFLGDNIAYLIGDQLSDWIEARASKSDKFGERLAWAKRQIRKRGGTLLITARFIPGGRTALTLSCGITAQPRRWFMGWIAIAATVWATYAAGLGYFFGARFENNHTLAFLIAFGTALSITFFIEVIRHYWGSDDHDDDVDDAGDPGERGQVEASA